MRPICPATVESDPMEETKQAQFRIRRTDTLTPPVPAGTGAASVDGYSTEPESGFPMEYRRAEPEVCRSANVTSFANKEQREKYAH